MKGFICDYFSHFDDFQIFYSNIPPLPHPLQKHASTQIRFMLSGKMSMENDRLGQDIYL